MSQDNAPVWFITGCSTGFGRELAKLTIARGWPTIVTARDKARVADLAEGHDNALAIAIDVTGKGQIASAVKEAEERFGRIDVLVNNAGYGYQSSIEEGDDQEIRAQFEANVFGLFAMTRAVLPGMRTRRRGHVINITSVAGFIGFPASGYSMTPILQGYVSAIRRPPRDPPPTCCSHRPLGRKAASGRPENGAPRSHAAPENPLPAH